ncbi:unnamed protein product [Urochloa humidicola]
MVSPEAPCVFFCYGVSKLTRLVPGLYVQRCAPKTAGSFGASFSDPGDDDHGPALDALISATADAFRPLLDNLKHVVSLKSVSDANDYNVGIPFGLFAASVGCYQLFKIAPSVLLDVVLGYLFYKLSVVSSQLHRQGLANDLITRIKFTIAFLMIAKRSPSGPFWVAFIRTNAMFVCISTFLYDICGWKESGRYDVSQFVEILRAKLVEVLLC